jgi:flagellar biosynthesis protein FlhF
MSTPSLTLPQVPEEHMPTGESPSGRIYRGRSVAELIPRIQADLGPEAIVLRRRSGLEGGIGGFFQRPFVEIEAREGAGRVDFYDGADAAPKLEDFAALSAGAELHEDAPQGDVSAFANALAAAGIAISDTRAAEAKETAPTTTNRPLPQSHLLSAYSATQSEPGAPMEPAAPAESAAPAKPAAPAEPEPVELSQAVWPLMPVEPLTPAPTQALSPVVQPPSHAATSAQPAAAQPAQPAAARSRTQLGVVKELVATGMDERFALELIDAACAHVLVFNPRIGLRKAVRIELERRIPTAAPLPSTGAAIVLAGPGGSGKTRCVASLAGIYRTSEMLKVSCASLLADGENNALTMLLSPAITAPTDATGTRALRAIFNARAQGLALIDTPSLSPADQAQIKMLGKLLAAIKPDRVVLALPATLGRVAASQLVAALKPLQPSALAITHAEETDQIGVAVQTACESGLAPEYLLGGARGTMARLDPATLAQRLLR